MYMTTQNTFGIDLLDLQKIKYRQSIYLEVADRIDLALKLHRDMLFKHINTI